MSDFSRDELEVIAGARRALAPSAQDTARVLHRARLAIGSGVTPAADASSAAAKSATAGVLGPKVASWLVVAGIAAWLGYYAGFSQGEQHARNASLRARPDAPAQLDHASATRPPSAGVGATLAAVALEAPDHAVEKPIVHAAEPRRKQKSSAQSMLVPQAPVTPPTAQPSASLDAEIKALRFVERALRNREPQAALARLAQLDRDVPEGQMREERAAAQAMARCEARALAGMPDHAEVMQRVLAFSQQYPASVYFTRVRQTCLATIDRDAATD